MKRQILLTVILQQVLLTGCIQYTESVVSKSAVYENIENGWKYENNKWYYYDKEVNFSPAIYSAVETIDSTYKFNQSTKKHKKKVSTNSTGFYETSEPYWKWDNGGWSYKGNHIVSIPPSFTRKITKTAVTDDLIKNKTESKNTIMIEEFYQVTNQRWSWGAEENAWLLDGNVTDLLPPYSVKKTTKEKTIHSGRKIKFPFKTPRSA